MNIPQTIQKRISNRQWYHQRFDGSPMFLYPIIEAELRKEKRKPAGTEGDVRVGFYSHGIADWYIEMEGLRRGAKVLVNQAKRDSQISSKLLRAWEKDEEMFEKFFWKEFPEIRLKKLTDEDLIDLWERSYQLFVNRVTSSAVIDHFALGTDELIQKMLRKEVGKVGRESEFTEIFSIATAPVNQSFISNAEIDLLKIATKTSKETLAQYQKRYFWTKNNYYVAKSLTVEHFRKDIESWRKSGKDLNKELKYIQNTPRINKTRKSALFRRFRFSQHLKTLLKISEDFTWWQDERKKSTYLNIHIGSQILSEIARRAGYKLDELKYGVPPEVLEILYNKRPTQKGLQKRRDSCVLICTRQGHWVETGRNVEFIRKLMFGSKKIDDIQDIQDVRGLSACLGRVIGIVKVVKSATEVDKVKQGEVLVAVMTRPDYVPAMKKAAAIVTDEGGITSHAAIVARELGVPCLIGTKIATSVFKDGDKIEVNANHGWARKIT